MDARIAVLENNHKHTEAALEKLTKDVDRLTTLVISLQATMTQNAQRIDLENRSRDEKFLELVKGVDDVRNALTSDENAIKQAVANSNAAIKQLKIVIMVFTFSLPALLVFLSIFSPQQILKLIDILKGMYGL
jgi:hypothetical protein